MSKVNNKEVLAFHPGYYIDEIIEEMGITQEEFAIRLGTTPKTISKLVNGETGISNDLALKLASLLNSSPEMWLNLQKSYDAKILELQEEEQLKKQVELIKQIDYSYFVKLGFLSDTRNAIEKIKNLCSFLSVARLGILLEKDYNVSYRNGIRDENQKNILNANVWVETVTKIARDTVTQKFDMKKFNAVISEIAEMTLEPFGNIIEDVKQRLADCGVVLVLLPYLKNSGLHGFVKWLDKGKVVIAISDRRKSIDTFWFTFFHEARHVQQKKIKLINFTWKDSDSIISDDEADADSFSQSILIPMDKYRLFLARDIFTVSSVRRFATEINRHPGIVVGRLQNDKKVTYASRLNELKTSIEF